MLFQTARWLHRLAMGCTLRALAACGGPDASVAAAATTPPAPPTVVRDPTVQLADTEQHLLVDASGERSYPIWVAPYAPG